jgi:hypothetical protein
MNTRVKADTPRWFREIFDGEQLLSRSEQERFWKNLHSMHDVRRVDPQANLIFHLSIAAIKHYETLLFLEKVVQRQTGELISLRTKIKKLEGEAKL